jgi:hypothetical protein
MEVLLILAVVVGLALGVGLTTWCLSHQSTGKFAWVVDTATNLSQLEKSLNHFSEEGFGIHSILSPQLGIEPPAFVIIGRRVEYAFAGPDRI